MARIGLPAVKTSIQRHAALTSSLPHLFQGLLTTHHHSLPDVVVPNGVAFARQACELDTLWFSLLSASLSANPRLRPVHGVARCHSHAARTLVHSSPFSD